MILIVIDNIILIQKDNLIQIDRLKLIIKKVEYIN